MTGEPVNIFKKKDRGTILVLTETAKNLQILQVKLKWFDSDDPVAFGKAREFLTDIAELDVAGKITKEDLVVHRDEALQNKLGVSPEPRGLQAAAGRGTDRGKGSGKGRGAARKATAPQASSSSSATPSKAKVATKVAASKAKVVPKVAAGKAFAGKAAPAHIGQAGSATPLADEAPCTPPPVKKAKHSFGDSFGEPPNSINEMLSCFVLDA